MTPRRILITGILLGLSGILWAKFLTTEYVPPKMLAIPYYAQYYIPNDTFNPYKIFPIGWSFDGRFAYAVLNDWDDAIGNIIHFRFVIQDVKNNKTLWEFQLAYDMEIPKEYELYNLKSDGMKIYIGSEQLMRKIWSKNEKLFTEKLVKYEISQGKNPLKQFPLKRKNDIVDCGLNLGNSSEAEAQVKTALSVTMVSLKKGIKPVWGEHGIKAYGGKVEGYFQSPLSEYIAVVISKYIPSYSGYPAEVVPVIVGTSLEQGFKK
ncbi:MAG: hypothetical protein A2Y33_05945 [Spirochaetes bacterium GWF1_51_8]|nr:MAG: hypothetical protein A2Y33_05945 [Spirochaetes bacterium GWF1_51_8]